MSEINSIAQGTYTLGQTSATTYQAGPGISITQPSEGTVRISNDETVLYEGTTAAKVPQSSISLSEGANKFERLDIIYKDRYLNITDNKTVYTSNITFDNGNNSRVFISAPFLYNSATPMYIRGTQYKFSNYNTMTFETNNLIQVTTSGLKCNYSTTPDNNGCYVWKIVGINRRQDI